ncbi:MAG: outer membrane protein transport protein, partial [Gammaproteobacteria bacterium]|nr:outer membrane protein transport protein [Gammaproteobacteria bacterium]
MKTINKRLIACAVTAALTVPMTAMATNGYFAHGYGQASKGLAGGGSALPQDAMAAADNPAGMVMVGERMDVGFSLFSPSARGYRADNPSAGGNAFSFILQPGSYESENDIFLIPHFAYNWKLGDKSTVGVSVYGNGGMNTEYIASAYTDPDGAGPMAAGTYYAGTAGVNLEQLFTNVSYSSKIDDKSSWGASVILAYQRFEATGLASFTNYTFNAQNPSDKGVDDSMGFGFKLGWMGEVSKGLTLAASYQSEIGMSEFDKYNNLFADRGDFDIPATWTLGLAWETSPKSTLTFDVQSIMYSDINAIANPLIPNIQTSQMGNSDGAGFGWDDMMILKLGYQWETADNWIYRVGYSHSDQPIGSDDIVFNILAPAVIEDHFTFGMTMPMANKSEFTLSAMYAPEVTVSGNNQLAFGDGSLGAATQNIAISMSQWELGA